MRLSLNAVLSHCSVSSPFLFEGHVAGDLEVMKACSGLTGFGTFPRGGAPHAGAGRLQALPRRSVARGKGGHRPLAALLEVRVLSERTHTHTHTQYQMSRLQWRPKPTHRGSVGGGAHRELLDLVLPLR